MKISGFTIIRNAELYDFPIVECVKSTLDLVDEFVIVAGDSSDGTDALLESISSPKVRVVRTTWDLNKYPRNAMIYAYQTDLALRECTGDWCLYIQSDEVLHHDGVAEIRGAMERELDNPKVEGFVLSYTHLYGNYRHYIDALHFAYPYEIRVVRGHRDDIHSWRDAQSFRVIENFDYRDYYQEQGTRKLRCKRLKAQMFHYGWSRDPRCMAGKVKAHVTFIDKERGEQVKLEEFYDYGNLSYMPLFKGTHPRAMQDRVAGCSWEHLVRYTGAKPPIGKTFGLKYRLLSFVENRILGGRILFGFRNYELVK